MHTKDNIINTQEKNKFHAAVLVNEVVAYLNPQPRGIYIDATFGGGSHSRAILQSNPTCRVIAIDWDMKAIEANAPPLEQEFGDRFKILWGNFATLHKLLKKEKISMVNGLLADFGTSQFQIHQKAGFSFQNDTPLDMRMSPAHQHITAADLVNTLSEKDLATILFKYGEDPMARKIARAIVLARGQKTITTTEQLTQIIEWLINPHGYKHKFGIHPATKTFQALRIEVNHELENIQSFLKTALHFLQTNGRIVCISFHSLEDRIVKTFFKEHESHLEILTTKPITATDEELAINPSARSAKLRAAQMR